MPLGTNLDLIQVAVELEPKLRISPVRKKLENSKFRTFRTCGFHRHCYTILTLMAEINLNADYIPELVEFWAAKYKAIKEELESHKVMCFPPRSFWLEARAIRPRQASSGVEIEKERRALAEERKKLQEILSSFHGERLEWRASEKGLRDTTSRVREEASASQKNLAASEKEISQLSVRLANLETEKLGLSHTVSGGTLY